MAEAAFQGAPHSPTGPAAHPLPIPATPHIHAPTRAASWAELQEAGVSLPCPTNAVSLTLSPDAVTRGQTLPWRD